MNTFSVRVKTSNSFPQVQGAIIDDLKSALFVEAEMVMTDSKFNYVPVDTGNLRNTGTVLAPTVKNNRVEVRLGYGSSSVQYAFKIHEAPKSWGQGRNKYLTKPLNKASHGMESRIATYIANRVAKRRRP